MSSGGAAGLGDPGRPAGGAAGAGAAAGGGPSAGPAGLDPGALRWAVEAVAPGAEVTEVRGLRDGGSPWLVRLGNGRAVVLRLAEGPDQARTEVAALTAAARHGVPAPELLAADLNARPPLVLTSLLAGSSAIPARPRPDRLRALGAAAAALHAIPVPAGAELPRRDRPIAVVDFAALRRAQPPRPLLVEAEERLAARPVPPGPASGSVHGDLWQGNTLWDGDRLVGLIDWDCAGVGPAGVDIGSLRCDAAVCFGVDAAAEILRGWADAAGRPADDVAYWDVVAALSTPPDMGWFAGAIAGQGRADLTRELLLERRDEFLRAALAALD